MPAVKTNIQFSLTMRFLILAACLLALTQAEIFDGKYKIIRRDLVVPHSHEGFDDDSKLIERPGRIINGYRATNGQFPWAAELTIKTSAGNYACTASLLNERYVLSAYHCVKADEVIALEVAIGSIDRQSPLVQLFFSEAFWFIEPTEESRPDITIIRLSEDVTFNPNLQPIRLPPASWGAFTFEGWAAFIMGFGYGNDGALSRYLQYGHYMFMPNDACSFAEYEICAISSPNNEISTQGGDSGGPWVVFENNIPVVLGTHWGRRWNSTINMHRATRVSSFLPFIHEVTEGALGN